jgi:hypothetical protein
VGALAFALVVGIATARSAAAGSRALVDSDAATALGDYGTAIARARDAAEGVAPGSPYPRGGYARLEAIARAAEARRDERTATASWAAMREAATASSSPLGPTDAWRGLADEGLVRVGAAERAADAEVHAREATLRAALAHEDAPATGMLAVLGLGAAAFLAGCARLAFAARDLRAVGRERLALAAVGGGAIIYALVCLHA